MSSFGRPRAKKAVTRSPGFIVNSCFSWRCMLPGNLEARTCSLEALDTIQVLAEFLKSLQKEIHLDYILSMLTVLAALQPLHPPTATCAQI